MQVHIKTSKKPGKRRKHSFSMQMTATESHDKLTSKKVTSNEKSSDLKDSFRGVIK